MWGEDNLSFNPKKRGSGNELSLVVWMTGYFEVPQENVGLYGVRFYCFDGLLISFIVKGGPVRSKFI